MESIVQYKKRYWSPRVGINNEGAMGGKVGIFEFKGFRAVDVGRFIREGLDLGSPGRRIFLKRHSLGLDNLKRD